MIDPVNELLDESITSGDMLVTMLIETLHALARFQWQPIETAPKDGALILVYGKPEDTQEIRYLRPAVHAAYWDHMDDAFCLDGATWVGPFIKPTHWMPLPPLPNEES